MRLQCLYELAFVHFFLSVKQYIARMWCRGAA